MRDIEAEIKGKLNEIEAKEGEENPQMPVIRDFIASEITRQKEISDSLPDDHNRDWSALNRVFGEVIRKNETRD